MLRGFGTLVLALATAVASAGVAAQGAGDRWVRIDTREIDLGRSKHAIDLSKARGSFKALRVDVADGTLVVSNLEVRYQGGSAHLERRELALLAGQRMGPFTLSGGERFLDSMVISSKLEPQRKARLEIWGLQSAQGAAASRPGSAPVAAAPPAAPPDAAPSRLARKKAAKNGAPSFGGAEPPRPGGGYLSGGRGDDTARDAATPPPSDRAEEARRLEAERQAAAAAAAAREAQERRRAEATAKAEPQPPPPPAAAPKAASPPAAANGAPRPRAVAPPAAGGSAPPPAMAAPPPGGMGAPAPKMIIAPPSPPPPVAMAPPPPMAAPPPSPPARPALPDAASPPAAGVIERPALWAPDPWDVVPVFYGTDRGKTAVTVRAEYNADRAKRLELGRALVTVPKNHQVPKIELPVAYTLPFTSIVLYREREDPQKHFTLKEVKALTKEEFLAAVRERLGLSQGFKGHALVFVHGFSTTFDYALFRTAQIAYDLKFDGASFLYSWPSRGAVGLGDYGYDRESAHNAEPHLRTYLELVARETGATSVSIIAHSMGNQLLLPVLRDLKRDAPPGVAINQVILAAPDVDRDGFENLARSIQGLTKGVTLYAATNDRALEVSRRFWGGIPRAGDVPFLVVPGVETIDISSVYTQIFDLGHSGYAEKTALLNDMHLLIRTGEHPPENRIPILVKVKTDKGEYWRYPPIR